MVALDIVLVDAIVLQVYEYAINKDYPVVIYRGSDPLQDKLNDAIALLNDGDAKSALTRLEDLEAECRTELSRLSESDQDILRKAEINAICDESQWYKAMAYMRTKKVYKAKHHLKTIAASNGTHAEEAAFILEDVF